MKKYELSLTRNYVCDWTIYDAIREILQNAIDANTLGYPMNINYWFIDHSLTVFNKGAQLTPGNLLLGGGNKTNDNSMIGGFSEGFKIALLVLLRNNHSVSILNGNVRWTPKFEYSEVFKTDVLKIEETSSDVEYEGLEFIINGISNLMWDKIQDRFPIVTGDFGDVLHTKYGDLLKDKKYKGKIFVGGLYIQTDNNFTFGYNFNPVVVELNRDRKAINYHELLELTSQTMLNVEGCDIEVFDAITNRATDCEEVLDFLDEANDQFLGEYVDHLAKKKKIEDVSNTIVATKQLSKYLENEGYNVVVGTEVESMLYAKYKNEVEVIKEAKEEVKEIEKDVEALINFKNSNFQRALCWLKNKGLSDDDVIEFFDLFGRPFFGYWNAMNLEDIFHNNVPQILDNKFVQQLIDEHYKKGSEDESDEV